MGSFIIFELKKLFLKKTTWILLLASAVIAVLGLIMQISENWWIDNSARIISMCGASLVRDSSYVLILTAVLVPLFSSIMHSDTYFLERRHHLVPAYISRKSRRAFFTAKAIVVLLSSFFIAILPLLFNQILCQLTFPAHSLYVNGGYYTAKNLSYEQSRLAYLGLYYNHPLLYNYLHILFFGLYGAAMGFLSYVFSLYYKKQNLLLMSTFSTMAGFAVVLFAVLFDLRRWVIIYYLPVLEAINNINMTYFYGMLGGLFLLCTAGLIYKIRCRKDVL